MDDADRAQPRTDAEIAEGIARALRADEGEIVEVDGVRHCCDCDTVIPPARIAARPDAGRCVDCQAIEELREARHAAR